MQNPIAKLVPQYFGEYPKPFQKLFNSVSFGPDQNEEEVKSVLWQAYEFGKGITKDKSDCQENHILHIVLK